MMPTSPVELETMLKEFHVPGASVATVSSNRSITTQTAGIMRKSPATETVSISPKAVSDTSTFEAASLSKPVFAYIILKMIQAGKFDRPPDQKRINPLDRPLHEIAPFGPPELREGRNKKYYESLTARMILSHQAGLPNEFAPDHGIPFAFLAEPGTRFDYSGEAYFCLMDVAVQREAALQGMSKGEYEKLPFPQKFKMFEQMAQREFTAMGMDHSSFVANNGAAPVNRATGHDAEGIADTDHPDYRPHFPAGFTHPAASLVTTAEDYAKFLNVCVRDPFMRARMFTPQVELKEKDTKGLTKGVSPEDTLSHIQWGLGMGLQTTPNGPAIAFHWGDINTNRAFTAVNLETNAATVCLTNSANGPRVFRQIAEPVVGNLNVVSDWLSRREGLDVKPNQTQSYKQEFKRLREQAPGYLEPTDTSSKKERDKFTPLPTTPKPWK